MRTAHMEKCGQCGLDFRCPMSRIRALKRETTCFCSKQCRDRALHDKLAKDARRRAIGNFWPKVNKAGPGDCWIWTASKDRLGYGKFGRPSVLAYRFSYELHRGKIPSGLELDHLCRNPSCVNPEHLEAVTHRVNMLRGIGPSAVNARKTHCKQGHPLVLNYGSRRYCGKCIWAGKAAWQRNRRAELRRAIELRRD